MQTCQTATITRKGSPAAKTDRLLRSYMHAKAVLRSAGYEAEAAWQASLGFDEVTETDFLRESAWVILSSGFRESVVRRNFSYISLCFLDWESGEQISKHREMCRATALCRIRHPLKIDAILSLAECVRDVGFRKMKEMILEAPLAKLREMPYIGPVTVYHLAKNLGLPVAKPDRHLSRLARSAGFGDVQSFCSVLSEASGDPVPVVDIVLWRYATIVKDYLRLFPAFRPILAKDSHA